MAKSAETQQIVESIDLYGKKYHVPVADLQWRPSAYAIITQGDNILLLQERGAFHMPGGDA